MHPSLQEHDLKHPGLVDLITTKQNKLPSFIDRFHHFGTLFFNVVEGKVMKVLMVNFVDATKPSHKEVIKRSLSSFALFVFILF
jgi:hypothetical protein